MKNRISPSSRWPADPAARLARATTDLEFVAALQNMGCQYHPSMTTIACRATLHASTAQRELDRKGCDGPK